MQIDCIKFSFFFAYIKKMLYICTKFCTAMTNESIEMSLMDSEERELVEYILKAIPAEDKKGLSADDILFVLDMMDDYLEEKGLLQEDEESGEMVYLDGDVDETEQLNYVLDAVRADGRAITGVQIQLIQDAELQFGIEKGYYSED